MKHPLTHILTRVFVQGFYQAHAGLFLFLFLVMIGAVDPGQLIGYHKTLMLAFITSPVMLLVVFGVWLVYNIKCCHYIAGQLLAPQQHFLFYSLNAFSKTQQLKSWFAVQLYVLLPVIAYSLIAVCVGIAYHYYLAPVVIITYLVLLSMLSAWLYTIILNRLINGSNTSVLLRWSGSLPKPHFSLYLYHVLNRLKVPYIITKVLSWLIITGVFRLFDDVKADARVAGIAVLAIAVAHAVLVFEKQRFEQVYLSFVRNFPYPLPKQYRGAFLTCLLLLLPEVLWLFGRFNALLAVQLLLMALSMLMLLNALIYYLGLNMDKYLQWVMGLFVLVFWVMMFKQIPALITGNIVISYLMFQRHYYRDMPVAEVKK